MRRRRSTRARVARSPRPGWPPRTSSRSSASRSSGSSSGWPKLEADESKSAAEADGEEDRDEEDPDHEEADDGEEGRREAPSPAPGRSDRRRPGPRLERLLGGNAQAQRPRHDLEARRRRSRLLAVELDRERLVRVDADALRRGGAPPSGEGGACPGRSSAASRTRSAFVTSPISRTSKRPSSGSASGVMLHSAPQVPAVGDDHLVHRPARCSPSTCDPHLGVLPPREHRERRPEVRRLPAERLRRRRSRASRPRRSSRRRRRSRTRLRRLARPGAVTRRGPRRSPASRRREATAIAVVELRRDAERADEVDPGAAGDDGELDAARPDEEPVDDLVDRAVAADGDDEPRARLGRLPGELARDARAARRRARRPRARAPPRGGRAPASAGRSPRSPRRG